MPFIARFTQKPERIGDIGLRLPVIGYIHESGYPDLRAVGGAKEGTLFVATMWENLVDPEQYQFLIVAIYRKQLAGEDIHVSEFFAYEKESWPGNPEVRSFVFENAVYRPSAPIGCAETLRVIGEVEEPFRVTTKDLAAYLEQRPPMRGLQERIEEL